MANHLKPNDPDYQDDPDDVLLSARIFVRALGFLLKAEGVEEDEKNEGIVVDMDGKRYIVFHDGLRVTVEEVDEEVGEVLADVPEGTMLWVNKVE